MRQQLEVVSVLLGKMLKASANHFLANRLGSSIKKLIFQALIAFPSVFRQSTAMSDKQLALDSIQRLPEDASLDAIAQRLEFLAGIRKGLDQIERGETVSHEEVKRQLATWLTK